MALFEGDASFQNVLDSTKRQIRLGSKQAQGRVAQSVKKAGLRTSGVGMIPVLGAERNRQLAEAGAVTSLGSQRLSGLQNLESIEKSGAIRERLARLGMDFSREQGRKQREAALRNALIGGVTGMFSIGGK